ncbi:MAG: hypothetical protein LBT89_12100, partial [Planctomycetaceae bacterium]|nr:hypothetical protein [Planctomycetaceae bacterium]
MKRLLIVLLAAAIQGGICQADTVSITPRCVPVPQIEQTLRHVLNEKTPLLKQIQFDTPNKRIVVNGNTNLCGQFTTLIQSIDQPSPPPGRERRIVKIQNTKPQVLARAFES